MTTYAAPICLGCAHFTRRMDPTCEQFRTGEPPVTGYCEAYPDGIPVEIWRSAADHREPFAGDRGISFAPLDEHAAYYAARLF